jgi:hypothetical protein
MLPAALQARQRYRLVVHRVCEYFAYVPWSWIPMARHQRMGQREVFLPRLE